MLHDTTYPNFETAKLAFFELGCGAMQFEDTDLHTACTHSPCVDSQTLENIKIITELSGHDIDGLASDLNDFGLI